MSLESTINVLVELWRNSGVEIRPAATAKDIAAAQAKLGARFPPEVEAFYSIVDGMATENDDYPIDSRYIRIWPLSELRIALQEDAGNFAGNILFADYMLSSHEYCFGRDGTIVFAAGNLSRIVSPSFSDFLRRYGEDDPRIFGA